MNNNSLAVDVCMITYNHADYIREAIESVLMQVTTFPVRLVIGEDSSEDETRKICEKYRKIHPDKILLLPSEVRWGMMKNFIRTLKSCNAKYIALCEGDDFWTDSKKLQKQFDLLEAKDDYVLSFHNSKLTDKTGGKSGFLLRENYTSLSVPEIFAGKIIPTQTVMYRNLGHDYPYEFSQIYNGDTFLFCWLANNSRRGAYYHKDIMPSGYRIHDGGNWSNLNHFQKYLRSFQTMKVLFKLYPPYRKQILGRIQRMQLELADVDNSRRDIRSYTFRIIIFGLSHLEVGFSWLIFRRLLTNRLFG